MAIVVDALYYDVQPTTDYQLLNELRYGTDGSGSGTPELDAGAAGDLVTAPMTWDSNLSNGLDSGSVQVSLLVRTGDTTIMQWTVGNEVMTYYGPSYTNISELAITAADSAKASISWNNMQLSFFSQGSEVDSYYTAQGPKVDQTGLSSPQFKEDVLTVTPQNSYVDEIRMTATIRMTAPQGVSLSPNALFGQVLIKAS